MFVEGAVKLQLHIHCFMTAVCTNCRNTLVGWSSCSICSSMRDVEKGA
jgi:hypothetical protein